MNTSKNFWLLSIVFLFFLPVLKGQDVVVMHTGPQSIDGNVNGFLDFIQVQITNNTGSELKAHFRLTIQETKGYYVLDVSSMQFDQMYEIELNKGGNNYSIRQIIDTYTGLTEKDLFESGNVGTNVLEILQQARRLPPSEYITCLQVLDVFTLDVLGTSCHEFIVEELEPPVLTNPYNEYDPIVKIPNINSLNIIWAHFPTFTETYTLEIKVLDQFTAKDLIEGGNTDEVFDGLVTIFEETDIMMTFRDINANDITELLNTEDIYAVRVTASNSAAYRNHGRSNIGLFRFMGPPVVLCDNNEITGVTITPRYPLHGDTIPFNYVPCITTTNPFCSEYRKATADLNITLSGSNYYRREAQNIWPRGPLAYLRGIIPDATEERAMTFYYNPKSDQQSQSGLFTNGGQYTWSLKKVYFVGSEDGPSFTESIIPQTFTYGMMTPNLQVPEYDARVDAGDISFEWSPVPPDNLLPDVVKLMISRNYQIDHVQSIGDIREKCIVQIASDSDFTSSSILYGTQENINMDVFHNTDRSDIESIVYRRKSFSHNIERDGVYYWRVLWIKNPNGFFNATDPIPADAYYASKTSRFRIGGDDGPGGGGTTPDEDTPDTENDITNCNTDNYKAKPTGSNHIKHSALTEIQSGYFNVKITEHKGSDNDKINGEGWVKVDFLHNVKIKVKLENVKVDQEGHVKEGKIKAVLVDPSELNISEINDGTPSFVNMTGESARVDSFIQDNPQLRHISYLLDRDTPLTLPIGFQRTIEGNDDEEHEMLIGITAMDFAYEDPLNSNQIGANVTLSYNHKWETEDDEEYNIAFGGRIGMKPSGFEKNFTIGLTGDLVVTDKFKVKGSPALDQTQITFDCACVESFGLVIEHILPKDHFKKVNPANATDTIANIRIALQFQKRDCEGRHNESTEGLNSTSRGYIVKVEVDDFQFHQIPGWTFKVGDAYLDKSSASNPSGMSFPDEYSGTKDITWEGFYLKNLTVSAPKDFYDDPNRTPLAVGIENLIIDKTGFTCQFVANNILRWSEGSADGWEFSIDRAEINIVQNAFRSGSFNGKIGLPIQAPATDANGGAEGTSHLKYSAMLYYTSGEGTGLALNLNATRDIVLKMPAIKSTATFNNNSFVYFKVGHIPEDSRPTLPQGFDPKNICFRLAGKITIDSGDDDSFVTRIGIPQTNFVFTYSDDKGFPSDSTLNYVGFASPQKYIGGRMENPESGGGQSGFPMSVSDFKIESDLTAEYIRAKLSFTVSLNLVGESDGGFQASVNVGIPAKYTFASRSNRFQIEAPEIGQVCIGFSTGSGDSEKSEKNGVSFKGCLEFYKNQTFPGGITGTGLRGHLEVGLPVATVALKGEFGITTNQAEDFRYFYVDGKVIFNQGLTLGAIQLMGLGGGFYYNMRMEGSTFGGEYNGTDVVATQNMMNSFNGDTENDRGQEEDPNIASLVSTPDDVKKFDEEKIAPSGNNPIPQNGTIGMKLLLPIATAGDASVFNIDVSVSFQINSNLGIAEFRIFGDGYVMASPKDQEARNKAPLKLDVSLLYSVNPVERRFEGNINIWVNYQITSGSGDDLKNVVDIKGASGDKCPPGVPCKQERFNKQMDFKFINLSLNYRRDMNNGDVTLNFKLGQPRSPGALQVGILDLLQLKARLYLQAGNDLDEGFMVLPALITRLLDLPSEGEDGSGLSNETERATGSEQGVAASQTTNGNNLAGFKTGFSLEAEINLNMFLIYAKITAAVGFDLAILKQGGILCRDPNGGPAFEKGANGWYTEGRIYAGIEGEIGLQIQLIKKRQFSLFKLGAAFMLQGGFPNPTYADGRVGVYYSVLNGLITGNAQLKVTLGQKCIPARSGPFDFPIIDQVLPFDDQEDVDPFYQAKASFIVPMDQLLIIPVLNDEGESDGADYLMPVLDKVELWENGSIVSTSYQYSNDKKEITIYRLNLSNLPDPSLQRTVDATLKITIKAKEWIGRRYETANKSYLWPYAKEPQVIYDDEGKAQFNPKCRGANCPDWTEVREHNYTIAPLPPQIPDSQIEYTMPVKNQRYHLKDAKYAEQYGLKFKPGINSIYFKDEYDGVEYVYQMRFKAYDGSPAQSFPLEIYRFTPGYGACGDGLFDVCLQGAKPNLENNTIYNVSIVRVKKTTAEERINLNLDQIQETTHQRNMERLGGLANFRYNFRDSYTDFNNERYNAELTLSRARRLHPNQLNGDREELVYSYDFKTSQFNTLQHKLAGAEVTEFLNGGPLGGMVTVRGEEPFDRADLLGDIYNPVLGFREGTKGPLFGLIPDNNNKFHQRIVNAGFYGLRSRELKQVSDLYKRETIRLSVVSKYSNSLSNTDFGESYFRSNGVMYDDNDNYLLFSQGSNADNTSQILPQRFKIITASAVAGPLTQSEIDRTWDMYLTSLNPPSGSGGNNTGGLFGGINFNSGRLPTLGTGTINISNIPDLSHLAPDPVVLHFNYDRGFQLSQDVYNSYRKILRLYQHLIDWSAHDIYPAREIWAASRKNTYFHNYPVSNPWREMSLFVDELRQFSNQRLNFFTFQSSYYSGTHIFRISEIQQDFGYNSIGRKSPIVTKRNNSEEVQFQFSNPNTRIIPLD